MATMQLTATVVLLVELAFFLIDSVEVAIVLRRGRCISVQEGWFHLRVILCKKYLANHQ